MKSKVKSQKLKVFFSWGLGLLIFFISACSSNGGGKIPAFSTKTIDEKSISNESLKGKIVVLNIWASWCGPCLKEIPELNELVDLYATDTNVVFIAMTDDKPETVKAFLETHPFKYQHISETKSFLKQFSKTLIFSYPQSFVIDKQGNIIFESAGTSNTLKTELQQKIESAK